MNSLLSPVAYTTGWNPLMNAPLEGEVWLSEDEARERFDSGTGFFQVIDAVGTRGEAPSFILEIRPYSEHGWLKAARYNGAGSVVVSVDIRPREGRYFVDRVFSWTYPDAAASYQMNESTSITTATFEPDGTGTLTVRDKLDPANDMRVEARDIPVAEHWVDRFGFGQWDVLLELPMLKPTRPLVPPAR